MARRSVLLVAALAIAALGTALILVYVQGINARAQEGQELIEVLIATEAIETGETIEAAQAAGKIESANIVAGAVVDGALSSTKAIAGKVAIAQIYPGEQIIGQKFNEAGAQESLSIPEDKLAISVELTDPARVAGFVNPGSSVAIFVSADPELIKSDGTTQKLAPYTRLLLDNVEVIGVGATTVQSRTVTNEEGEKTTEEIPRTILTLAVDQEQAERTIYAARNGDLSFALLSERSDVKDQEGVTAVDIMPEVFRGGSDAMTLIVENDPAQVELFQSVLGGSAHVLAGVDELESRLREDADEYAVVLGPSVGLEFARAIAEAYRVERPSLGVILVRNRVDSSLLSEAMRSGVREVVESRDMTGLSTAVSRAYSVWQAMTSPTSAASDSSRSGKGHLYTVFSTKGGVGKSMIATNLASALAQDAQSVCLVDLDIQAGDVAIMMRLRPLSTIADLRGVTSDLLDPSLLESLLTRQSDSLSVLAAPLRIESKDSVSPQAVHQVLRTLKTMFDVIVVDTSGSFDDYALNAFDHSDALVLVGTLDIPALKNLKLAADTLDLLNIPRSKWRLVLNRADDKVGLSVKEFADTLGLEVAISLPTSREVLAAVNRGEAIVTAQPRHPVSQAIRTLADQLVQSVPSESSGGRRRAEADEPRLVSLLRRKAR